LDAGHSVSVFSYQKVTELPTGVKTADARSIYAPNEDLIANLDPLVIADVFKLYLMKKTQMTWVNADMLCVKPFEFPGTHLVGQLPNGGLATSVLRLPSSSPALEELLDRLNGDYPAQPWMKPWQRKTLEEHQNKGLSLAKAPLDWRFAGPKALTEIATQSGEIHQAKPSETFTPVAARHFAALLAPEDLQHPIIKPETYGVHLWANRITKDLSKTGRGRPDAYSFVGQRLPTTPKVLPVKAPNIGTGRLLHNYHHDRHFMQIVHGSAPETSKVPFVYMKNHKAACTTILATLLRHQKQHIGREIEDEREDEVHKPPRDLMLNGKRTLSEEKATALVQDPDRFKFTIIRDPVARTVSAYADKILKGDKQKTALMDYLGKPADTPLTLSKFLQLLAKDPGALDVDRHWRPQHKEISYGEIDYDFIGTVEAIGQSLGHVTRACFGVDRLEIQDTRKSFGHRSDSKAMIDHLSKFDHKNLRLAFEKDFEMYEAVQNDLRVSQLNRPEIERSA
jgi:hypothetical protein